MASNPPRLASPRLASVRAVLGIAAALLLLLPLTGCGGGGEEPGSGSAGAQPGAATDAGPGGASSGEAAAGGEAAPGGEGATASADEGWTCTLLSAESTASTPGVSVSEAAGGEPVPLSTGATIARGAVVRTDASTRAVLKLSDGGLVVLDRDSELVLRTDRPRAAELRRGQAVFDLPPLGEGAPHAAVRLPTGEVTLLGTKIAAVADDQRSVVTVTRGRVASGADASAVEAGPGEVIALPKEGPASVATAPDLGAAVGWAELGQQSVKVPRGLGSLSAKQPGRSHDDPLRKVSTEVTVRVQGLMAYTEITEVFENPGAHTLEGVYRFPLPDDAQISRLALLVGNRLMEGVFVENQRAAAIWAAVISEWRDPAWLRWQHGNQFELRIFPIEPHSSRQVTIGYTQRLRPTADGRAYVYPMPVDLAGAMPVGRFSFRAELRGHDMKAPLEVDGYPAQIDQQDPEVAIATFEQTDFRAGGDLVLRYSPSGEHALRAVAWQDATQPDEPAFAALAIRPTLPRADVKTPRDLVLVADRSYSRTGAAASLQAALVAGIVAEMDPADRLVVIACNETCVPVGAPGWRQPDADTAARLKTALEALPPEGATNLLEAVRVAATLVRERGEAGQGRTPRIVMLTDGIASAGALDPAALRDGTRKALAGTSARLTVADLGGDRDALAQEALARGGSGSVIGLEPAATLSAHALAILGRQYGTLLEDLVVTLPQGFEQVLPDVPAPLAAGEELVVVGRLRGQVRGEAVVSGTIGGEPFSQRFALELGPSTGAGNAFAARLWAEQQIRHLELEDGERHRAEIVGLSQRFSLLSRHTSLLALESREMMREFGLDEAANKDSFDGTAPPTEVVAEPVAEAAPPTMPEAAGGETLPDTDAPADTGSTSTTTPTAPRGEGRTETRRDRSSEDEDPEPREREAAEKDSDREKSDTKKQKKSLDDRSWDKADPTSPKKQQKGAGKGPMPKGWRTIVVDRVRIEAAAVPGDGAQRLVDKRRKAVDEDPTSVTRRKALVRALSMAERFDEARKEAADWLALDPMDAEALVVSAEVEARLGHADRAERLLASAVDAQPRAKWLRERLSGAYTAIGNEALACAHRVSLAAADERDRAPAPDAMECPLASDLSWLPGREGGGSGASRSAANQIVERKTPRGDLSVELDWNLPGNPQAVDLDLGLVPPSGRYTTWLGGEGGTTFLDVVGSGPERMVLDDLDEGTWRIDVVRRDAGKEPVRAKLTVKARGESRSFEVTLSERHATVATVDFEQVRKRVKQ